MIAYEKIQNNNYSNLNRISNNNSRNNIEEHSMKNKKHIVVVDLDKKKTREFLIEREHKRLSKKGKSHIYKGEIYWWMASNVYLYSYYFIWLCIWETFYSFL